MDFPSKLLEQAVNEFASLPGIGKKTALRLVLHLLKRDAPQVEGFGNSIIKLRNEITYCRNCHNISDTHMCHVCSNPLRDQSIVCVVEDIRDVMAIENTGQYRGRYHILGGIISPMDGIGPKNLNIDSLIEKVREGKVSEVIMALSTTMEGDTTNFFIYKKLKEFNISISTIARGVSVGDELQYADEVTLARSIMNRVPYENSFVK
jgi:recombination protein RecR